MKDLMLVLAKGLLWLLIVLLLRPLNFLLDWSLAAYVKVREAQSNFEPNKVMILCLVGAFVLVFVLYLLILIYG